MIRFIAAAPKTGSSYISACIIIMQCEKFEAETNYRVYPPWWRMGSAYDWDLRPKMEEVLVEKIDPILGTGGAIYKGHFWATQKNLGILKDSTSQHLVIIRSPADTLVAQYCATLYEPEAAIHNPIYPIEIEDDWDVEHGIMSLIRNGYLAHLLMFFADWLDRIDFEKGMITDFESFCELPVEHLMTLAEWCDVEANREGLIHDVGLIEQVYTQKPIDEEHYPRGWSGKENVWKQYFSDAHVNTFCYVYDAMLKTHPGMQKLNDFYEGGLICVMSESKQ